MSALLLCLAGPMQSWGTQSRWGERDTGQEPSKSGVIGLLCAAEGRPRAASVSDLAGLRFGARVERPGVVRSDFWTALEVPKANGARPQTVISHRYYLADAVFLVGFEGSVGLLERLDAALAHPRWPLFLGRRGYPPGSPVRLLDGLRREESLEDALRNYPTLVARDADKDVGPRRVILDDPDGELVRYDVPISFAEPRRFGLRRARVEYWTPRASVPENED